MNLSDMLGCADIGQLSRIASVYQCECNSNSKNELIQSILGAVSRNDVFEQQISSMAIEDLRFLNSLLFETRDAFSLEELLARAQQSKFSSPETASVAQKETKGEQQISGEEASSIQKSTKAKQPKRRSKKTPVMKESSPRDTIVKFKHQGWLFNGFTGPNRYLFQVPEDLKQRFRETLKRKFAAQLVYADEPHVYRDEQELLQADIRQLLHYIHHNEVTMAADGSIYKRFSLQLLDLFSIKEELPGKGEWRFGYGKYFHHYPNRMSLLYDYCVQMNYFLEEPLGLRLTPSGQERLLSAPANELQQLYKCWLKQYKGPIPNILALVQWIGGLSEQWVTAQSLSQVLVPLIKPFYYDDAERIFQHRLLGMLVHLGLIRLGEHEEHGVVIKTTKAGKAVILGISLEEQNRLFMY
ncbi:hypothetical protein ABEW34_06815 [Paenibacillus algorifonticola]|uniref:hypothetical protein n=1 Tax=Paenibacillus algorifonticola TaxID=684063 RepID=UPI003D2906F5